MSAGESGVASAGDEPANSSAGRRQGLRLALILLAAFMVVLDFSIVNVALPSIERELGMTAAAAQWVITGYAIAFAGLLILGGRAADLLGRRRMFIIGLLAFTAASLSGGLAHDPVLLIASRVVQGAGAAVVAPAALSLITTSFADGRARTRALGLYGATASIGFVAGQVLGGVLVQFTSWRAVFLVNVPIGLAAAALAPRLLADSRGPSAGRRLDARGRFSSPSRWLRWSTPSRRPACRAGAPRRSSARWPCASRASAPSSSPSGTTPIRCCPPRSSGGRSCAPPPC